MPQKKETAVQLSPEEQSQVDHLLAQYPQIAQQLHGTRGQEEIDAVLASLYTLSQAAQITFIKLLGKERQHDAADILVAINTASPQKDIRKEARRSLIRLEASKVTAQWQPPETPVLTGRVATENLPRFWRGYVTQSREQGEMQLMLCWEQGFEYNEARSITFLLDFWEEGIKGIDVDILTKRRFEDRINQTRRALKDMDIVDCTLAEAKRLILEALSVNTWKKKEPHRDFRNYLPMINNLILEVDDPGEDRGRNFITPEMEDQETIVNFLGGWSFGDYGLAYDLLSRDNNLRGEVDRDEWIKLHRAWNDEAKPARMELGFVHERPTQKSGLWLPTSLGNRAIRKEIEVGWSLGLNDTPLSGTLTEMPMGTTINKETGRHWFWTNYTMIQEDGSWRILNITDEGKALQSRSVQELQQQIKEYEEAIDKQARNQEVDPRIFMEEVRWRLIQLQHFYDALIALLPLDYQVYEDAYAHAVLVGNPERMMAYLEKMLQRFPNNRGDNLRRLGACLVALAQNFEQMQQSGRAKQFIQRAESVLRESVEVDDKALSHILLGELALSQEKNEEAYEHFMKARDMNPSHTEKASIEANLGNIAMRREQPRVAIGHYEQVVRLDRDYPGVWFSLGFAHRLLNEFAEAEQYYQRAIEADREDLRAYTDLTAIYMNTKRSELARKLLEDAIQRNSEEAALHALLASVLAIIGDVSAARRSLAEAERINPDLPIIQEVKNQLQKRK